MKKLITTLSFLPLLGLGCNNTTTTVPQTKPAESTPPQEQTTDSAIPEDELTMIQKLYATVPEISEKSQEIRDASNGDVTVSVRIDKEHKDGDMYPVQVFEDHDTHTVTLWTFYISSTGDSVTHLDELTGEIESLETWRATRDELPE
ncbi:MAG: hypothetical protein CO030_03210 [Candidatus Magasanikbacteria bacterium CG_4_9_14_0_2_um_filter_42_11]|uniref:Uncharacterized protein n=1 Tax=Candidatus Magasanikbacteria bacterium CG_4_9_14_0_2_um_filter_42_11 TaxID=1974643 RepID=A0A2M8F9F6_9BACT|nr:MAG: hypothetical protein COU34_01635 [Candidatus Magasanikbacteria bacterium CG10_big_fil_rev_8_21_14_0_10_43_9]PIY92436.1 MAG: hypothetical protein COY70_03265 [Candidatus Magasanikbacteria bacterium CG_4_10_14_0_8_um_filter_42_12]PJC52374.1 MAG: hypothetical protein CO030_03210 [Candidatus Magasanikbacteria bacterium CG_4_9_14_0_2_um_filter_42_11]